MSREPSSEDTSEVTPLHLVKIKIPVEMTAPEWVRVCNALWAGSDALDEEIGEKGEWSEIPQSLADTIMERAERALRGIKAERGEGSRPNQFASPEGGDARPLTQVEKDRCKEIVDQQIPRLCEALEGACAGDKNCEAWAHTIATEIKHELERP